MRIYKGNFIKKIFFIFKKSLKKDSKKHKNKTILKKIFFFFIKSIKNRRVRAYY
jgi:hypothetical protein